MTFVTIAVVLVPTFTTKSPSCLNSACHLIGRNIRRFSNSVVEGSHCRPQENHFRDGSKFLYEIIYVLAYKCKRPEEISQVKLFNPNMNVILFIEVIKAYFYV